MDMRKPATDFSGVGYEEALRRARELIPFLREQAAACEAARKLTPAVIDALTRTGLMRYLQPKAWGGMELPFVVLLRHTGAALARRRFRGMGGRQPCLPPPQPHVV